MHPSSSFDKKLQSGRQGIPWSERVISRRRALVLSDSDSIDTKQSLPPPPESLLPNPPSETAVAKKCSSCSCKKSSSSVQDSTAKSQRLQHLEAKLYNAELEDATVSERSGRMRKRLHRVTELLAAQAMYVQSLDLKVRALDRLTQLSGNFAYKELRPSDTLAQVLDKTGWDVNLLESLSELQGVASAAADTPDQVYQLQEELRDRQKDYQTASNNFSQYLRSATKVPSSSLLRKFESQYDEIKDKYKSSCQLVEREYPKLIDERQNALQHCFSKLAPLQETIIEQDKQFLVLSREISKVLQEPSKRHSCRQICGEKCFQPISKQSYG